MRMPFLKLILVLPWSLCSVAQTVTGGVTAGDSGRADVPAGIKVGRIIFGNDGSVVTLPAEAQTPPAGVPETGGPGASSAAMGGAELRFRHNGEDLISADGRRYRRIGNTLFGDDGSTFLELGDRVIGSDGQRYRWAGVGVDRRLVPESLNGTPPPTMP